MMSSYTLGMHLRSISHHSRLKLGDDCSSLCSLVPGLLLLCNHVCKLGRDLGMRLIEERMGYLRYAFSGGDRFRRADSKNC